MSINYDLGRAKTDLAVLPEKMLDWAFEVLMDRAHVIVGRAQILVRVETGSLRDSIRVERGGESMHWRTVRVRAGGYVTNPKTGRLVDYAAIVEEKYPYLGPAVMEELATITEMIKAKVVEKANV